MNENGKTPEKSGFRARAFVSFGVFLSFLAATTSGIILFLRPEGSLASWAGWDVLGVDKKGWEGFHIVSIILLVGFTAAHLRYNWKVLTGYVGRRTADGKRHQRERIAALIVVTVILAATIMRLDPIWKIVDLRSEFKRGTFLVKVQPPAANAEEMPFAELCALVDVPLADALKRLGRAGYPVDDPKSSLAALAKKHRISPAELFRVVLGP